MGAEYYLLWVGVADEEIGSLDVSVNVFLVMNVLKNIKLNTQVTLVISITHSHTFIHSLTHSYTLTDADRGI